MTPKEAGQRIRALADEAAAQLHEPGGTPARRTFETSMEAVRIILDFASNKIPGLARYIVDVMPDLLRHAISGSLSNVAGLDNTADIAQDVTAVLADLVEQQMMLDAPGPAISADTPEDAKRRATIAVLDAIELRANDPKTTGGELVQLAMALRTFAVAAVHSTHGVGFEVSRLQLQAQGLAAAQDAMKAAGIDISVHPANAVGVLIEQRDEARATVATLENELVKAKAASSGRESTAAVHVLLDTMRFPEGQLWDRIKCVEHTRNRLDNAGFKADDISMAARDALNELDAARKERDALSAELTATSDENAKLRNQYEGVRKMLDILGERLFERYYRNHVGHKEWPKTQADDYTNAEQYQAVPGDVRSQFAALLTLIRYMSRFTAGGLQDAKETIANLRNELQAANDECKRLQGELRKANDAIVSSFSYGEFYAVKEENEELRRIIDNERRAHRLTSESLQNANNEVTKLRANDLRGTHQMLSDAIAETHKFLDDAKVPGGHIVERVKGIIAERDQLCQKFEVAEEQTTLQSRTIKCLAALLDTEVATKDLVALVKAALALVAYWRNDAREYFRDVAIELERAIKEALKDSYDALVAAIVAKDAAKPIGIALHDAQAGDAVAMAVKPEDLPRLFPDHKKFDVRDFRTQRRPSEF